MELIVIIISLIIICIIWIIYFGPESFPFYSLYSTKKKEHEKQQWVRGLDILILGPFIIWLGYELEKENKWGIIPYLLYIYGFGTIIYNFINYHKNIY